MIDFSVMLKISFQQIKLKFYDFLTSFWTPRVHKNKNKTGYLFSIGLLYFTVFTNPRGILNRIFNSEFGTFLLDWLVLHLKVGSEIDELYLEIIRSYVDKFNVFLLC